MDNEYIKVPTDPRFNPLVEVKPKITNQMKADCIGEFSWTEDSPYYNEDGKLFEGEVTHVVPWNLCKEIYKAMAIVASKEIKQGNRYE